MYGILLFVCTTSIIPLELGIRWSGPPPRQLTVVLFKIKSSASALLPIQNNNDDVGWGHVTQVGRGHPSLISDYNRYKFRFFFTRINSCITQRPVRAIINWRPE